MISTVYVAYFSVYVALMFGIGVYYARKIKSMDQYLVADRNVGFWRIVGTIIATSCGAAAFIGFVGMGFAGGISGIFFWIVPATVFGIVLATLFGRILRRIRMYTIPDVFALRFGKSASFIPSLFQIFIFAIPALAIQYIGMGTILATFFGMGMKTGIVVGFVIISIYTLLGGLPAVIDTDRIQAIILTLALFLFFLFGIRYAGGMEKVLDMTPVHYWAPLGGASIWTFLSLALTVGPFYLVWQTTWQRIFAAKDEKTATRGISLGVLLSGLILCFSFLIGIIARSYLSPETSPDLVFTEAINTVFPAAIGGLIVVGLAAALMSGADSFIMMGSASITRDIYQRYLRPNESKKRMLRVCRWSVVLISLIGLIVALWGKGIIPIYILVVKTAGAGLVFPFLALMFWRRATRKGVTASMLAGCLITVGWYMAGNSWVIEAVAGYLASLVVLVVVSLLTSHAPDEQVKAVYFEPLGLDENVGSR